MKIFVLIPAYDEKGNLKTLVLRLKKEFKRQKIEYKIFFVIQGTDGSSEVLDTLKKSNPQIDYVHYDNPLGIGSAYKIGYRRLDKSATHVLTMDADLNHDIKDLPRLLSALKGGRSDLVIGSRFVNGGKFNDERIWKRIASRLTNRIITGFSEVDIKDISSGYRLMRKEVAEKISPKLTIRGYPSYMEFILYAHRYGFKIREVPITYHPRIWGKSKISTLKTFFDYLKFFMSIKINY